MQRSEKAGIMNSPAPSQRAMVSSAKRLSRKSKIQVLMAAEGLSRKDARAALEDMGEL